MPFLVGYGCRLPATASAHRPLVTCRCAECGDTGRRQCESARQGDKQSRPLQSLRIGMPCWPKVGPTPDASENGEFPNCESLVS
ncbi:conserved hypothetical protein [Ricinus communis]|uniref:Uncharacterized protein n=1 Tax=Ricinus communis TaxID=3988 RepID=B9TCU9_RICCO|nr:conserved hypothetical protein [Ricinus communis]